MVGVVVTPLALKVSNINGLKAINKLRLVQKSGFRLNSEVDRNIRTHE